MASRCHEARHGGGSVVNPASMDGHSMCHCGRWAFFHSPSHGSVAREGVIVLDSAVIAGMTYKE
jgi:hypothetical protein